ncbi:MAG: endonuclease/exonuclease/phosphatase family protein [Terrimicrobiaceae bacterium]|nr:endonuclease/exonuclease/phosphatase family protein [Terrimicrobiaceae bacterium]
MSKVPFMSARELRGWIAPALFALAFGLHAQTTFSVLQTNIHRDIGGSDSNVSAQPYLAQQINMLHPDVWTLQELGGNSAGYNATTAYNDLVGFIQSGLTIFGANPKLNLNFYVYLGSIDDGFDTTAIVSRYPILSAQTFSDAGGGYGSLRGLAMTTIDIPGTTNLDVFTAHLKASGSSADAARRMAEADADRASIAGWIANHPADAVIATGDWNETIEAGESANWSGHSLGDPVQLASGITESYNPVAKIKSAGLTDPRPVSIRGDVDTISSNNPNARFDYVMYGSRLQYAGGQVFDTGQYTANQLAVLNVLHGTTLTASTSASASDYLAVFETFQVVPEPGTLALLGTALLGLACLTARKTISPGTRGATAGRCRR